MQSLEGTHLFIYDDILAPESIYLDSQMSAFKFEQMLESTEGDVLHIHINSYGGHISEGLAIGNLIEQHPAKVITYNDGFCCSAATLPFLAGDVRVASQSAIFMTHNGMTSASGYASDLRKQADVIERITKATIQAFVKHTGLSEEDVQALFDAESWFLPEEALQLGVATTIQADAALVGATQSVRTEIAKMFAAAQRTEREIEFQYTLTPPVDNAAQDTVINIADGVGVDTREKLAADPAEQESKQRKYFNFRKETKND